MLNGEVWDVSAIPDGCSERWLPAKADLQAFTGAVEPYEHEWPTAEGLLALEVLEQPLFAVGRTSMPMVNLQ